jgi:hypothetical protein
VLDSSPVKDEARQFDVLYSGDVCYGIVRDGARLSQ